MELTNEDFIKSGGTMFPELVTSLCPPHVNTFENRLNLFSMLLQHFRGADLEKAYDTWSKKLGLD